MTLKSTHGAFASFVADDGSRYFRFCVYNISDERIFSLVIKSTNLDAAKEHAVIKAFYFDNTDSELDDDGNEFYKFHNTNFSGDLSQAIVYYDSEIIE
jgi:hypothetical protein